MITAYLTDSYMDRGLRRLAHAVLLQAFHDLEKGSNSQRADAMMWLFGRARGPFTFEFCCTILDRKPDDIRRLVPRTPSPLTESAA